jgi:nucleoside-diphosphate-sugar epimerase
LANMILRLSNSKSQIIFKPHPGPEVDLRVPSIEKAISLLDYRPTVSLESGVRQSIEWYASHLDAMTGKVGTSSVPATA